ncbi:unknown [Prevotella sp. CAG:1185]|nr:unknown [Prevotella sp. CAG:1185]
MPRGLHSQAERPVLRRLSEGSARLVSKADKDEPYPTGPAHSFGVLCT